MTANSSHGETVQRRTLPPLKSQETMRLELFLQALNNVNQRGAQHYASCPAHEDRNPSLGIRQGDKGILVTCYAGCSTAQIVDAMGLSLADLFQDSLPKTIPKKVKAVPVVPEYVVESYQKRLTTAARRYLRQHRMIERRVIERYRIGLESPRYTLPIPEKGRYVDIRRWLRPEKREDTPKILSWKTGYGGARLYPEDQLQEPAVVLCEGELDALALISCGIPAITLTSGAATWPQSASKALQGHRVYILMDNAEAGIEGAKKRRQELPESTLLQWPERPEGWDATDEIRTYGAGTIRSMISSNPT